MVFFKSDFANFFFALLLPALIIRVFFLQKKISADEKTGKSIIFLFGVSQDCFVICQLIYLYIFVKILFVHAFLWAFAFIIVVSGVIQLNLIFDAFFFRKTSMRLELSFLSFFNDIRCFWDSAKEKSFLWFFPSALFFLTMHVKTFIHYQDALYRIPGSLSLLFFALLSAFMTMIGSYYFPKKLTYQINNIVILQEIALLTKVSTYFTKKKRFDNIRQLPPVTALMPTTEHFTHIDKNYPLLKITQGFQGEKEFNIRIDPSEKPHIICLFMESFRAKNTLIRDPSTSSSPCFSQLAQEGILFENFYANSIKTSRSVTSSLFGIPSDIHSSNVSSRPGFPSIGIADIMQQNGYQTSYLHNGLLQFEKQLDFFSNHGFEKIIGRDDLLKAYPRAAKTSWGVHDEYLMRFAADWLEKEDKKGKPLFTTMFTISNHHPWTMPPGYEKAPTLSKKTAYTRYLQTFRYSDQALGLFLDLLREKGLGKKTIIFILGDHGQPMGEHHDNFSEQKGLYEENIHVPLLIIADGRIAEPAKISSLGSQIDLLPTIMDLLQLQGINHSVGQSLMRKQQNKTVFFHNPYGLKYFGLRNEKYKCIYTKDSHEIELYDITKDHDEQTNIADLYPSLVKNYRSELLNYESYFSAIYENYRFIPHIHFAENYRFRPGLS